MGSMSLSLPNPRKRKFESSDDSGPSKRPANFESAMQIVTGSEPRRYSTSSRRKSSSKYYGPKKLYYRGGPSGAMINRVYPELKAQDCDTAFIPISFGNVVDYTPANMYSINGAATDPLKGYTGTNLGGWLACVSAPPVGNQIFARIGSRIQLRSVRLTCTWRLIDSGTGGAVAVSPAAIRTALIWDKCPNGAFPTLDMIYQSVKHLANNYPMPRSPNNLFNRDRFVTLMDINDTLSPGGDSLRQYDRYLKLKGAVNFNGQAGAYNQFGNDIGAVNQGALYLVLMSDQTDATATTFLNRPVCQYTCRVRYTDA